MSHVFAYPAYLGLSGTRFGEKLSNQISHRNYFNFEICREKNPYESSIIHVIVNHVAITVPFKCPDMVVGGLIPDNFIDLEWENDRNSGIPEMETVILPLVSSLSNSQ
ncbi:hypothetical protein ALC56_10903 [Trachymyrmex septentrionalis]|uniref:Uncharacterized protein n=1 Tax=Trachymyrmex septentrionalis TaxID=34720 RepID=A0A195F2Y3_9HYME|nr:hypothetical protein ALC56_10903 [Trachymyrmex septentrionalis]